MKEDLNDCQSRHNKFWIISKAILTDQQYDVFKKVLLDGMSFRNIGKKLEISSARVAQHYHNARIKVQKEWEDYYVHKA